MKKQILTTITITLLLSQERLNEIAQKIQADTMALYQSLKNQ